jgi:hypothetical protein
LKRQFKNQHIYDKGFKSKLLSSPEIDVFALECCAAVAPKVQAKSISF